MLNGGSSRSLGSLRPCFAVLHAQNEERAPNMSADLYAVLGMCGIALAFICYIYIDMQKWRQRRAKDPALRLQARKEKEDKLA